MNSSKKNYCDIWKFKVHFANINREKQLISRRGTGSDLAALVIIVLRRLKSAKNCFQLLRCFVPSSLLVPVRGRDRANTQLKKEGFLLCVQKIAEHSHCDRGFRDGQVVARAWASYRRRQELRSSPQCITRRVVSVGQCHHDVGLPASMGSGLPGGIHSRPDIGNGCSRI